MFSNASLCVFFHTQAKLQSQDRFMQIDGPLFFFSLLSYSLVLVLASSSLGSVCHKPNAAHNLCPMLDCAAQGMSQNIVFCRVHETTDSGTGKGNRCGKPRPLAAGVMEVV